MIMIFIIVTILLLFLNCYRVRNTAGFMTYVTCRLTAKNRDQLRIHTLGSQLWAAFTFLIFGNVITVASEYIVIECCKSSGEFITQKKMTVILHGG